MNRIKIKYEDVISIENLIAADQIIRYRCGYTYKVEQFDKDWYDNIYQLHIDLKNFTYEHSGYDIFHKTGADGKCRLIHVSSNYRDRIVQKAIVIVVKDELIKKLVGNTYSSVPGRGSHKAIHRIQKIVRENEMFCLQLDVRKFFESINQGYLISVLHKTFKDDRLVWLFERMIHAVDRGLVLGAEDSQWWANLCLTQLDHIILQQCKPANYFRYCDDLVLLDPNRCKLEQSLIVIRQHIKEIGLTLKPSARIFLIAEKRREKGSSRQGEGLDFLGYVFYRNHTDLRNRTKKRWRRRLYGLNKIADDIPASKKDIIAAASIRGLTMHCNSNNLLKKWKNEYPNYYARLRRRKAAKAAVTERRKKELATVLQQTRRTE